ncbi:n-acetyltransferase domain-containing protein [Trichonephila clavipes]|nr:n-acetyltransferase domain-containing protein [Trichonephila clavipes]
MLRLNLDSFQKTTWFHSAAVQFTRAHHQSKRWHRWVGVKGITHIGRHDAKCPSYRYLHMAREDTAPLSLGATCAWIAADESRSGLVYGILPFAPQGPPNCFFANVGPLQVVIDPLGIHIDDLGITALKREIIGSVTSVKNTESLYYGGMFCVHENYRDTDVGRKVLTKSFARAQGNTLLGSVGLHQIPAFTRRGVKVIETDWNSLEYETDIPVNPSILSDELPSGVEILSFQNSLLPAVFEYDYLLVGFDRRPIIEASCKEELSKTLVAMKDGKCVGFGSIKLDIAEYRKLGPLYADDPSIAEAMAKRLITTMPEAKGFTTGTINTNLFANMILEKFNIPIHKSYYFLSTKERLLVDTKRVFAHLDLDFCPF